MKRRFRYFDLGEIAGVEIFQQASAENTEPLTFYNIQYKCCGVLGRLSHRKIKERIQRGSTECKRCNGLTQAKVWAKKGWVTRRWKATQPKYIGWLAPPSSTMKRKKRRQ